MDESKAGHIHGYMLYT